jgi:hypothetical protein
MTVIRRLEFPKHETFSHVTKTEKVIAAIKRTQTALLRRQMTTICKCIHIIQSLSLTLMGVMKGK